MPFTISAILDYRFEEPCEVLLLLEAARARTRRSMARASSSRPPQRWRVWTIPSPASGAASSPPRATCRSPIRRGSRCCPATPTSRARRNRRSATCPRKRCATCAPAAIARRIASKRSHAGVRGLAGGERSPRSSTGSPGQVDYRAGVSDCGTTALDTFVDRAGVCRDFTHLAISLVRAADIPARAVSAYAWKLEPPDLHAVAEVYLGGRWRMIDPTCRAPIDGLVRVATGLDAADIAFMTIFGRGEMLAQSFAIEPLLPMPPTPARGGLGRGGALDTSACPDRPSAA